MLKQLLEYFTKQFIKRVGRKPQTAAEMMSIQDDAVRYLNKTKGVPQGEPKPPFQGFTPKVIEGGKPKEGIGKAYDKFYDKTGRMRDRGADIMQKGLAGLEKKTLLKDSPEAIAKIKADNKAAIKRLQEKRQMTADELEDFEMDIGDALEGYDFDGTVGSAERILKEQKAYEAAMYRDYKAGRLDPKPGEPNRKRFLEKKLEEMEMSGDKKLMTREEIEELSLFDLDTEMDEAIKKFKQKDIKQKRVLEEFDPTDRKKNASGGLARVGMFGGGRLVKGASWVINKLKEQLFDLDLGIGGSSFSKLSSTQKEGFKNELKTLIKQLEQGGEIPNEMLDTMIADPKFKSVVKTRSTDKDLFELEGVLLDRQAGKQADQIVDDVFGKDDWEGEAWDRGRDVVDSLTGPKEIKRRKQIETLKKFDVKDRKPNASGGIAGQLHMNEGGRASFTKGGKVSSGLANILGV